MCSSPSQTKKYADVIIPRGADNLGMCRRGNKWRIMALCCEGLLSDFCPISALQPSGFFLVGAQFFTLPKVTVLSTAFSLFLLRQLRSAGLSLVFA